MLATPDRRDPVFGAARPAIATREWVASLARPRPAHQGVSRASTRPRASDHKRKRSGLNARRATTRSDPPTLRCKPFVVRSLAPHHHQPSDFVRFFRTASARPIRPSASTRQRHVHHVKLQQQRDLTTPTSHKATKGSRASAVTGGRFAANAITSSAAAPTTSVGDEGHHARWPRPRELRRAGRPPQGQRDLAGRALPSRQPHRAPARSKAGAKRSPPCGPQRPASTGPLFIARLDGA